MRAPTLSDHPSIPRTDELTLVRERDGLAELRAGWDALARRAARWPMQEFAWSEAYAAAAAVERPLVLVAGPLESPDAIAPLYLNGRRAELLGAAELGEPSDLLYADREALGVLCEGIARLRTPLLLQRLPVATPAVAALAASFRPRGVVVAKPAGPHPTIALDSGWTEPEGKLKSRRASDMRRARRRAEQAGEVTFEALAPEPDGLDRLLDEAFSVEASGWKGREGTALAADRRKSDFFRRYSSVAAGRGELRVFFLRIEGTPVAMQLAVEWDRRLWLLKIGYDEEHSRCSPGMLLMLEVTRWAAARELDAVQMLGSAEAWTEAWTDVVEECVTVAGYPAGFGSIAAAFGDAATVARRRVGRGA